MDLLRLRGTRWHGTAFSKDANDAADEIERLKQENAGHVIMAEQHKGEFVALLAENGRLKQENERLRKEYARAYEDSEWNRLQAEIERLKQENQDLKDRFARRIEG